MKTLLVLIPLVLVGIAIWLVTLIPTAVLAAIGFIATVLAIGGGVAFGVVWFLAGAMKS